MTAKICPYLIVYMPLAKRANEHPSIMPFDLEDDARRVFQEYTTGYAEWVILVDPEDAIILQHGDQATIDKFVNEIKDIMKARSEVPGNEKTLP